MDEKDDKSFQSVRAVNNKMTSISKFIDFKGEASEGQILVIVSLRGEECTTPLYISLEQWDHLKKDLELLDYALGVIERVQRMSDAVQRLKL